MAEKRKALVAVKDRDLKNIIFPEQTIRLLELVADVDWIAEGEPYDSGKLAADIGRYDVCITSWGSPKFTPEVLERAHRLRFIGHAAGTIIPIVDSSVFDRDIVIVNANRALAMSTAELTLALMLSASWDLQGYSARLKNGHWPKSSCETVMGLSGTTVGLVGYGEISIELIRLLRPFDVKMMLYSRHCSRERAQELGVELVPLDRLLQASDIISVHSTLTPQTAGMIGDRELELIRDGALLINTARAALIDRDALYRHLRQGRIYAALDVFEREPLDPNDELLHLPNVLCVPHIGGFSSYWKGRLGLLVVEDLLRFCRGEQVYGGVSREYFNRMSRF